jgi:hypothetical protein
MDDTYFAGLYRAQILPELRPSVTSKAVVDWFPPGHGKVAYFSTLDDAGVATGLTEGTDYTTTTAIGTGSASATSAEVGLGTVVTDLLQQVSLLDAMAVSAATLARSVEEKWETDLAAVADGATTSTTAASTLTPQDLLAAISAIEQRDAATGTICAYLHPKQTGELRSEIAATTALRTAAEGGVPLGPVTGETNGRGFFGNLFDVNIYQTSLVASSSSLRQGSLFVERQSIGGYQLRDTRVETQRFATQRGWVIVVTAVYGLAAVELVNRAQMLKSAA